MSNKQEEIEKMEARLSSHAWNNALPLDEFWQRVFTNRNNFLTFNQIVVVDLFHFMRELTEDVYSVVRARNDEALLEGRRALADTIEAIYKREKIELDDKKQNVLKILRGRE